MQFWQIITFDITKEIIITGSWRSTKYFEATVFRNYFSYKSNLIIRDEEIFTCMTTPRPMSKGQPQQPNIDYCVVYTNELDGHRKARNEVGCLSPAIRPVGFELRTLL